MPGILFILLARPCPAQSGLASELFEEGDWEAARLEGRRLLERDPSNEMACLVSVVSALRLGETNSTILADLERLAVSTDDKPVRGMASYELGLLQWGNRQTEPALVNLRRAYLETKSRDLFLHSGCALYYLRKDFPSLGKTDPDLFRSLETSRPFWTRQIISESRPPKSPNPGLLSKPGQWIVTFYRDMIRPGIGDRCVLSPSCSEYFRQASRQHGLAGLPMIADRLVREPGVSSSAGPVVTNDQRLLRSDPLCDHDFWMNDHEE